MEFTYLTTERLKLRLLDQQVWDHVFGQYNQEQLTEFFGESAVEKEKERNEGNTSTFNRTFLYFHLLEKDTNELIGWCGYHTWYTDHKRAELGYVIFDEENMSKGYMSEALAAIIKYGWEEMYLHRIEAFVGPYNRPSLRLIRKFKFEEEGRLKEHYFRDGIYEDSVVFGLLRPQK